MILFGFTHQVFIGEADIIAFYGIAGLLIEGLIFKSKRFKEKALFVIGTLLFVILLGVLVERKTWISHPEQHISKLRKFALTGILISVIGASPLTAITVGILNVSEKILAALHIFKY